MRTVANDGDRRGESSPTDELSCSYQQLYVLMGYKPTDADNVGCATRRRHAVDDRQVDSVRKKSCVLDAEIGLRAVE